MTSPMRMSGIARRYCIELSTLREKIFQIHKGSLLSRMIIELNVQDCSGYEHRTVQPVPSRNTLLERLDP